MSKKTEITYKQFESFLQECGYSCDNIAQYHKTYRHKPSNSLIVIPNEQPEQIVPQSIAAGVFKNLIESKIAQQESIDALFKPATILLSQSDLSELQKKALRLENKKEKGSLMGRFFKNAESVVIISNDPKLS